MTLANAIGTGVADDKSIYPYVPDDDPASTSTEEPILNNVPTYMLLQADEDRDHALAHLSRAGREGKCTAPAATAC